MTLKRMKTFGISNLPLLAKIGKDAMSYNTLLVNAFPNMGDTVATHQYLYEVVGDYMGQKLHYPESHPYAQLFLQLHVKYPSA